MASGAQSVRGSCAADQDAAAAALVTGYLDPLADA